MGLYLEEAPHIWVLKHTLIKEPRAFSEGPVKSARLYAPVPARFEAHSSVYTLSCFPPPGE